MPRLVKELFRAWFADEKPLIETVSDVADTRSRSDLLASSLKFVVQSVGGYVFVSALIQGLNTVIILWQTSRYPYALALLALQASIMLYAVVKLGGIAEQLSEIHGKMDAKRGPMIVEIHSDIAKRRDTEREGPE